MRAATNQVMAAATTAAVTAIRTGRPGPRRIRGNRIDERDSVDDSQWEMTMRIPMRFNRLVLLRPWFWHTAGPAIGDRPENGRLVYLMFFEQAR